MAKLNLSKADEQRKVLNLAKAIRPEGIKMQVTLMQDVSGSMHDEFRDGLMERVLQRTIAFASQIDPDGKLNTIAFSNRAQSLGELTVDAFDNATAAFTSRVSSNVIWGGTSYASALQEYVSTSAQVLMETKYRTATREVQVPKKATGFFGGLKNMLGAQEFETVVETYEEAYQVPAAASGTVYPELVIFITDGEDGGSNQQFRAMLKKIVDRGNTFVILLGAGNEPTDFHRLEEAAEEFVGVDFVCANGIQGLDNDEFYSKLLTTELKQFLDARK